MAGMTASPASRQGAWPQPGSGMISDGPSVLRNKMLRSSSFRQATVEMTVRTKPDLERAVWPPAPMVDGVLEPVVSRGRWMTDRPDHLGHGSDVRQASRGLMVSPAQRIACFRQQRGDDDPADAGKRVEHFHVTLRIWSWLFLQRGSRSGQRCAPTLELAIGLRDLLRHDGNQHDLREDDLDMGNCGLGRAGRSEPGPKPIFQ